MKDAVVKATMVQSAVGESVQGQSTRKVQPSCLTLHLVTKFCLRVDTMTTVTSTFVTVVIDEHTFYQIGIYATPPNIDSLAPID
jgi:hypothetical protein